MNNSYMNTSNSFEDIIARNTYQTEFEDSLKKTGTNTVQVISIDQFRGDYLTEFRRSGFFKKCEVITIKCEGYALAESETLEEPTSSFQDVLSVRDMIETIKSSLGINYSQMANILKVSRVTVYNHLKGDGPVELYESLYEVAKVAEEKYGSVSHVLKAVKIEGKTLLKHFEAEGPNINLQRFCSLIKLAMDSRPNKKEVRVSHKQQVERHISNTRIR